MITSIATTETLQLDAAISAVCAEWADGCIGEIEAEHRISLLQAQRATVAPPSTRPMTFRPVSTAAPARRFAPRPYQRSPDKSESRRRRRELACRADMPPASAATTPTPSGRC
jgi:hypothetical protein